MEQGDNSMSSGIMNMRRIKRFAILYYLALNREYEFGEDSPNILLFSSLT